MNKYDQTQGKGIQDIQNLVATGITPIIKLAEVLKPHIMVNPEAKTLLSDSLTLLRQVQFNLSTRRRYFIRPNLKKKYHSLCNISKPVTDKLFGDDITKDIKTCDSLFILSKEQNYGYYSRPQRGAGRGSHFPETWLYWCLWLFSEWFQLWVWLWSQYVIPTLSSERAIQTSHESSWS